MCANLSLPFLIGLMYDEIRRERYEVKKSYITFIFIAIFLFIPNVKAYEKFYQNDFGVVLTESEYEFISNMYWDGYQEYFTLEDYYEFKNSNIFEENIEKRIIEINDTNTLRSSSVTSNLRTLSIAKSCSDTCVISLVNSWNGTPTIKSYDVFGVRVSGVTITNIKNVLVSGLNYGKTYSDPVTYSNGFGYSVLVPGTSNVKISVTFITTTGGTIYGSYQHAMQNTTEAISKQYTIGTGGSGYVFNFYGSASKIYDNAPGVYIQV